MILNDNDNLASYLRRHFSVDVFVKILFFVSLILIVYINTRNSMQPILEQHGFRQTQTAITSYYLKQDGFRFNYETPVIGQSWSIPFEFPIYQQLVATVSGSLGASLTQTGRLISLLFTLLTCLPIFFILKRCGMTDRSTYFSMTLFLTAPVYLFWSGTFMIESTALFFTLAFLYFVIRVFQRDWSNRTLTYLALFLLLALLQKITTAIPALITMSIVLMCYILRVSDFKSNKLAIVKVCGSVVGPLFLAYLWVMYTDSSKMNNPIGKLLTSTALSGWNIGSLDQKISLSFWRDVVYERSIRESSLYFVGFLSVICVLAFTRVASVKRVIIVCVCLFVLPFLIFTNLYAIHTYYQVANVVYWSIAVGVSVSTIFDKYLKNNSFVYAAFLTVFVLSNYHIYGEIYAKSKDAEISSQNNGILILADYIKKNTKKDDRLILYGFDWSSELAFYSERKSLTLPFWGPWDLEAINNPEKFLMTEAPSLIVLCTHPNKELIKKAINEKYPKAKMNIVNGCEFYALS